MARGQRPPAGPPCTGDRSVLTDPSPPHALPLPHAPSSPSTPPNPQKCRIFLPVRGSENSNLRTHCSSSSAPKGMELCFVSPTHRDGRAPLIHTQHGFAFAPSPAQLSVSLTSDRAGGLERVSGRIPSVRMVGSTAWGPPRAAGSGAGRSPCPPTEPLPLLETDDQTHRASTLTLTEPFSDQPLLLPSS